jgi:hypothetical protein
LVDGQNCSGPGYGCLFGCAKGDTDCDWVHGKEYCDFGVEKICNPRGCEGDCLDGEIACYYDIPCVPRSLPVPLMECLEIESTGYWTCVSTYPEFHLCYYCTLDEDNAELHTAQFDYCWP